MKVIINQPFGIGDILFLSPLVSKLDIEYGIWPVVDHYYWIKDYLQIKNIEFVKQSDFDINNYPGFNEIPFRHAHDIISYARDCMEAKYMLLNANLELWKTLKFSRNKEKEIELFNKLNLSNDRPYILLNNNFAGPEFNYKLDIKLNTNINIVDFTYIDGFTLLDWALIIENAYEIHTVSTSLLFILESLNINSPIHIYPRKPLDIDLSPIKSLINKNWICHE
jgi:hypothetical protein